MLCNRCKQDKIKQEFYLSRGAFTSPCKRCVLKAAQKRYVDKQKELKEYGRKHYALNKETYKNHTRQWRIKNPHQYKINKKLYYIKNREYILTRNKANHYRRLKTDISYKILCNLRRRIHHALKGTRKSKHTKELLGCSLIHFKKHLEARFQKGMSWDNYGQWHIDHIKPCAHFDLVDTKQQSICFHYQNLQPLWAQDNLIKNDRILT